MNQLTLQGTVKIKTSNAAVRRPVMASRTERSHVKKCRCCSLIRASLGKELANVFRVLVLTLWTNYSQTHTRALPPSSFTLSVTPGLAASFYPL